MSKHLAPSKNKHLKKSNKKRLKVAEKPKKHISSFGFGCSCEHDHRQEQKSHKKDIALIISSAIIFVAVLFFPVEGWLKFVIFAVPYMIAGYEVIFNAIERLIRGEFLSEDFLMTVASIGAFCIGEYHEAVLIMLLYRTGSLFISYALGKKRRSVEELADIIPDKAHVLTDAGVKVMRPQDVQAGSIILVSPGERVPLDGEVIDGISTIDTSSLTGESVPRTIAVGGVVLSGCINISSPIKIKVTANYAESTATRILELIEGAYAKKSRQESFVSRFSRIYTPVVVLAALVIAVIPPIFSGNWAEWIRRGIVFLVVSCPSALVISVPLSFFGGIGCASRNGILIKGSNYLEALSKAKTFVLDKTGTITEGKFTVLDVFPENVSEQELLDIAAAAEYYSNHPIARSIKDASSAPEPEDGSVMYVEEQPGHGVTAFVKGRQVYVGNASLLFDHGILCSTPRRNGIAIHVAVDGAYWGYILVSDKLKEGTFDALESLRHQGANNLVMLTGDMLSVARPIASSLNFDMVKAELLPSGKVSAVEYLMATKADNSTLAFVGDGVNDAQVLARADVGIAIGAFGSDAAIEAADLVLMGENIRKLPLAMKIARDTVNIVHQNIAIALTVKFATLILGIFGLVPIGLAVCGDVGMLIIVILNALRAFNTKL